LCRSAAADLPTAATPALGAAIAPTIACATDSICLACNFDPANIAVTARTTVAGICGTLVVVLVFDMNKTTAKPLWIRRSFDRAVFFFFACGRTADS